MKTHEEFAREVARLMELVAIELDAPFVADATPENNALEMGARARAVRRENESLRREVERLRAENLDLVKQTGAHAPAFPSDRGDAAQSRGLAKLEWMAGQVESANVSDGNYAPMTPRQVVDRAAALLDECRRREAEPVAEMLGGAK